MQLPENITNVNVEQPALDDPLYTKEDTEVVPDPTTNNYSVVKNIANLANGTVDVDQDINFNDFIDSEWRKAVPKNNQQDKELAYNAAKNGNVQVLESFHKTMEARNALYNSTMKPTEDAVAAKLLELSENAVDNVVTLNSNVPLNNSIEQITNKSNSLSSQLAAQATLEKALADGKKWSTIGKGLLYEITPVAAYQGVALDKVAINAGVPEKYIKTMSGRSETVTLLQAVFSSLPEEEKGQWLNNLYKDLRASLTISELQATSVLVNVATIEDQTWDGLSDQLDRLGVAATFLGGIKAVVTAGKLLRSADNLVNVERTLASAGAKDVVVSLETSKIVKHVANKQRMLAAGEIAGELTGVSAILDLTKLVSMSASKVLPEMITTAAGDFRKLITNPVENLIKELQTTISSRGVTSAEAVKELEELQRVYSPVNNPNIHSVDPFEIASDGSSILGKVYYKPADSTSYLTEAAASAALKTLDPTGSLGMKLVPDTTNTSFLIEASVIKDLKLARDAKEAELLGLYLNVKADRERILGTLSAVDREKILIGDIPKEFKTLSFTMPVTGGVIKLSFDSVFDKIAYATTRPINVVDNKRYLEWATAASGLTEKQVIAHGNKIKQQIKPLAADAARLGMDTVAVNPLPSVGKASTTTGIVPSDSRAIFDKLIPTITQDSTIKVVSGIAVQDGTQSGFIASFHSSLGKALGMEDRLIVVLQMETMLANPAKYGDLTALMNNKYLGANAVHFSYKNDISIIVMRNSVSTSGKRTYSLKEYMETFAHEYAHAFETQFSLKYSATMMSNFNKWLRAKGIDWEGGTGINRHISQQLPLEAVLEYRNVTTADEMSSFIDAYFDGNKQAYLKHEAEMHAWLSDYSEFFAENFSKWAFSSEVPTTILGQTFAKLVEGFKAITTYLNEQLARIEGVVPVVGKVDTNTEAMLNKHVAMVNKEKVDAAASIGDKASAAVNSKPTIGSLQKEIEYLDEQLKASIDATTGLKTGWLIEKPITHKLDYSVISKYGDEDVNSFTRFALGDWALGTSKQLYQERLVGIRQESRYVKLLTEFVRPSVEKLSRSEMAMLNDVLVAGDKEGKVFNDVELAAVNVTGNTRTAYYKVRALRDVMHQIRNDVASKSLRNRGFLELKSSIAFEEGGSKLFVKPVQPTVGKSVYIVGENTARVVGDSFIEEALAKGLVFYELVEPVVIEGKHRRLIALPSDSHSTLKATSVLPYRAGEFSRLYSDEYWVRITSNFEVDGALEKVTTAHRTAKTAGEANAYVDAFREATSLHKAGKLTNIEAARLMQPFGWQPDAFIKELDSNVYGSDFTIKVNFTRTDDDYVSETISVNTRAASKRGDRVISVHGEDTVNTVSPLDSISAEIGNTAYVASATEWREAHVVRWYNTFADDFTAVNIDVSKMKPDQAFVYMLSNKGMYAGQTKRLQMAEKVQEYIISQMNIPTKEEKALLGKLRLLSESVEGVGTNKSLNFVGMALRSTKNYTTWARSISFHSFFSFNPVQFFVQGMNAFNAVAISPVHGLASAKSSMLYSTALMSDQESIWRTHAKVNKLTNLGLGMSEDEFVEVIRAIKRSGLIDNTDSAILYGAGNGKYSMFNGLSRKAGAIASAPFNAGEAFSKLVSFDIARREFSVTNPGAAWWIDDSLAIILKRQDDLTQNMTRANTAEWQRGWKSIPSQYVGYQVKLMMNVLQGFSGNKRTFTRREAAQLLIAHAAVMGTSGFFLWPTREFITGLFPEDMTETQAITAQQGIVAGLIAAFTDNEVRLAVGTRFNTFKWYEDIFKGLIDPEKGMLEVIGGPSGFAGWRMLGGVGQAMSILSRAPMSKETLEIALLEIGRNSFSAINNIDKAMIAFKNNNVVQSGAGKGLYRATDLELYALSVGIPPVGAENLNVLMSSKKEHDAHIKRVGKDLGRRAKLAQDALDDNDIESYKVHNAVVQSYLNSYEGADLAALRSIAYATKEFTMYEKLVVDKMLNQWKTTDLVTPGK